MVIQDEILEQQALTLLKHSVSSIVDILNILADNSQNDRAKQLRDTLTGKYTTILQPDANMNDIKDFCQKTGIPLIQTEYKQDDQKKFGYAVDNTKLVDLYTYTYEKSVSRNEQIKDILNKHNINYKSAEFKSEYRFNNSKSEEKNILSYKQQIFIDDDDLEKIKNIPELDSYIDNIMLATELGEVKDEYINPELNHAFDDISQETELEKDSGIFISCDFIKIPLSDANMRSDEMYRILGDKEFPTVYDAKSDRMIVFGDSSEVNPFLYQFFPQAVNYTVYVKEKEIFQQYVDRNLPENDKVITDNSQNYDISLDDNSHLQEQKLNDDIEREKTFDNTNDVYHEKPEDVNVSYQFDSVSDNVANEELKSTGTEREKSIGEPSNSNDFDKTDVNIEHNEYNQQEISTPENNIIQESEESLERERSISEPIIQDSSKSEYDETDSIDENFDYNQQDNYTTDDFQTQNLNHETESGIERERSISSPVNDEYSKSEYNTSDNSTENLNYNQQDNYITDDFQTQNLNHETESGIEREHSISSPVNDEYSKPEYNEQNSSVNDVDYKQSDNAVAKNIETQYSIQIEKVDIKKEQHNDNDISSSYTTFDKDSFSKFEYDNNNQNDKLEVDSSINNKETHQNNSESTFAKNDNIEQSSAKNLNKDVQAEDSTKQYEKDHAKDIQHIDTHFTDNKSAVTTTETKHPDVQNRNSSDEQINPHRIDSSNVSHENKRIDEKQYIDAILFNPDESSSNTNKQTDTVEPLAIKATSTPTNNGKTLDEITQVVKAETSGRNYYNDANHSSKVAKNFLDFEKDHISKTGKKDETITGGKKLVETDMLLTSGFSAIGLQKEINKNVDDIISAMNKNGKNHQFLREMSKKNGISITDEQSFAQVAKLIKGNLSKSGIDINELVTVGLNENLTRKYLDAHKSLFANALNKQNVNLNDIREIQKLLSVSRKIDTKNQFMNQSYAIKKATFEKMGTENMEGFQQLDGDIFKARTIMKGFSSVRSAHINLQHKRNNIKLEKYNQSLIKTQNELNFIQKEKVVNPLPIDSKEAIERKLKEEKYKQYIQKQQMKINKRKEKQEKLNNLQDKDTRKQAAKVGGFEGKLRYKIQELDKKIASMQAAGKNPEKIKALQKQRAKLQKKLDTKIAKKKNLNKIGGKKTASKFGKILGKVPTPLSSFAALKAKVAAMLKSVLIAAGKILLACIIIIALLYLSCATAISQYGMSSMIMETLFPWRNKNTTVTSTVNVDPLDTPMGRTYLQLKEAEHEWVSQVKNVGKGTYKLSDIDALINWDAEINNGVDSAATNVGYTYDGSSQTIKADPYSLGDGYDGIIDKVDGGTSSSFTNVNNNTSLSNIKDIMSLCAAYYGDSFRGYDVDAVGLGSKITSALTNFNTTFKGAVHEVRNTITQAINSIFHTHIQDLTTIDETEALAYQAYAYSLFDASHDTSTTLGQISILQTPGEADSSVLQNADSNGFDKDSNERILCTEPHGCTTTKEKFYWDEYGNLSTKDDISTTPNGTPLNSIIYVLIDGHNSNGENEAGAVQCYQLTTDDDKKNSPCWYEDKEYKDKIDSNGNIVYNQQGDPEQEEVTVYKLKCQGHIGSYCVGHIVVRTAGIIHGIPTDMATGRESANEDYENVRSTAMRIQTLDPVSTAEIDAGAILITDDIFDIDTKVKHNFVSKTWDGWTAHNVDIALQKYVQDWNRLYGFDVETSISDVVVGSGGVKYAGSNTYSNEDIEQIIDKLKSQYTISSDVERRLRMGLNYVGKVGYSQGYHGSIMPENGGRNYNYSDCSGFVSNIWYDKLGGLMTCYYLDEWGKSNGLRHSMSDTNGLQPGDIILSLSNKYGSGNSNHAVIYMGTYNGQIWGLECTSANNGGIFYMSRGDWYFKSTTYWIDMT